MRGEERQSLGKPNHPAVSGDGSEHEM